MTGTSCLLAHSPTCDYCVPGCSLADSGRQFDLYASPPIPVLQFRLIEDFEENQVRVRCRIVFRKSTPEIPELLNEGIVLGESSLEVRFWMHVQYYSQTIRKNGMHGIIEVIQILLGNGIRLPCPKHGLRINAEAHVVESHR